MLRHPARPAAMQARATARSQRIMKPRHAHIAPARAPIAPMHRGPQAHSAATLAGPLIHAPNAALLIDFDNVTMGIRSDLQTELRNLLSSDIIHGKVAVQRAYADWRRYPQYIVPLSEASIDLIFAPAYGSSKKNATDIRLAIDAMELVFTRPEIGTIILLSGDSDFSSLVIKLKEYGTYVIGVGIRESSSDLLVQNCDEYYSYNALAGLVKSGEGESVAKYDPWELVTEAITRMQRNGDVMRSDRLKQVMQEIDSTFDEKNLGISKFSKFCHEAAQKGLLHVMKLENGQLEVAPPKSGRGTDVAAPSEVSRPAETRAATPSGDGEEREGRSRRGRRGGRGRSKRERDETAPAVAVGAASVAPQATLVVEQVHAAPSAPAPVVPAPIVVARAPEVVQPRARAHDRPAAPSRERVAAPASDVSIGAGGLRLTRDEAFALVRDAVGAVTTGDDAVPSETVRRKAYALLGRDSESLSERNFARILRDAHDADVVDLRKRGDAFEVATAASVPSVADQLQVKEAALKAAADKITAANAPIVPRGMGPRGAPPRGGRSVFGGKAATLPPDFLLIGVVDDEVPPKPVVAEKVAKADAAPKAKGRAAAKPKVKVASDVGDETAKPKAKRAPRAKKAAAEA
jgi:uncharacterized protein (TIGR00288 family)